MTFLSATELRGHSLGEIASALLARIQQIAKDGFDTGAAGRAVSDMQVRRLGVRECNGRALI